MSWQTIGFTRETTDLVKVLYKNRGTDSDLVFGWLIQEWAGPGAPPQGPRRRVVAGVLIKERGEIRPVDEQDYFLMILDSRDGA